MFETFQENQIKEGILNKEEEEKLDRTLMKKAYLGESIDRVVVTQIAKKILPHKSNEITFQWSSRFM